MSNAAIAQGVRRFQNRFMDGLKGKHFQEFPVRKTLFDFKSKSTVESWIVSTDAMIGGRSTGTFSYNDAQPGAILKGSLSLHTAPGYHYSGFIAANSPIYNPLLDIEDYNAFEMRVKGDGRVYTFNVVPLLQMGSEDRLFQAFFTTEKDQWETLIIPFGSFISLHKGLIDQDPAAYEGLFTKRFGFLFKQRVEGPFHLEIEFINAVQREQIARKKRYDGL